MRKALILIMLATPSYGALSNFWVTAGGFKMARQDRLPYGACSTCTVTSNWNGTTVLLRGARNETLGFALYMGNATGGDIADVNVAISSFTGPNGFGIRSVAVSSSNVWDYTTRPIEVFYVRYVPIKGLTQLSWDGTEIDQRDIPYRFQRPCTVNINDDCIATGGTLWTDRQDHDKLYPEILVPYEAIAASSFTVAASSSQAIWFDIYIGTALPAGTYTGRITVQEGVVVSTVIPVSITVRNFKLPDAPSLKATMYTSAYNINFRHQGDHFPTAGEPYQTTRNRYAQMIHRHKFAASIGDKQCFKSASCSPIPDYPSPEYIQRMNGSLFTATSGYANGPGYGTGDSVYSIGTYGGWQSVNWSSSTVSGANSFCTNVSSWSAYFRDNFPNVKAFVYLADEPSVLTDTEKWANWMSTSCSMSGYTLGSFVTARWPNAQTNAPHVNMPATTSWLRDSAATWASAAANYETTGTTQAWAYNSHPSHTGSTFAIEDDGIAPVSIFWSMFKKGVQGWMFWEGTYFTDSNNGGRNNDLFNDALSFGFFTSTSTTKGRNGFQYSNGDGVLMYPGKDLSFPANDYNLDVPFASWRLKMLRRGIQDGDYMAKAYSRHPTEAMAVVNSMVPEVLWEHDCFDSNDCTYAYGGRSWSPEPETWEAARDSLAALIPDEPFETAVMKGTTQAKGAVRFK